MENNVSHIVILSEQSVRAKSLSELIHSATGNRNNIVTMAPGEVRNFYSDGTTPLFIVDLMGCHQPSQQILRMLKNDQSESKIIALHIYRSKPLIAPILSEGVDGYLYYEPTKAELAQALKNVLNGKKYNPAFSDA